MYILATERGESSVQYRHGTPRLPAPFERPQRLPSDSVIAGNSQKRNTTHFDEPRDQQVGASTVSWIGNPTDHPHPSLCPTNGKLKKARGNRTNGQSDQWLSPPFANGADGGMFFACPAAGLFLPKSKKASAVWRRPFFDRLKSRN